MNTDKVRDLLPDLTDSGLEVQLREALDEIDRLEKIEAWSLKAVKWLNEKDNEIAKIEQRTKEACKKAIKGTLYHYLSSEILLDDALKAIDSVEGQHE